MKTKIQFEDKGSHSVLMTSDIDMSDKEYSYNKPTPSVILALATKAMFENGMLARAGQLALKGIHNGEVPSECILAAFEEKKNDDTDT